MYRKTDPQLSLFDIDNMYPDILPPKDWCRVYRKQIYPLIDEGKFRDFYSEEKIGRPNKSIKTTIFILILCAFSERRSMQIK